MYSRIITVFAVLISIIFTQTDFTPEVGIQLEPNYELDSTDLTIVIGQDPGEIDIVQFTVSPSEGYWDLIDLQDEQIIGDGTAVFFDGLCDQGFANGDGLFGPDYVCDEDNNTEVLVSIIVSQLSENAVFLVVTISASNNPEYPVGVTPAGIALTNTETGAQMEVAYLQPDQGNTTQGHYSTMSINSLFINPPAGDLPFLTVLHPESDGEPIDDFTETIVVEIISPVFGCTDPAAINFNPEANVDDGSCVLGMPGDLDQSESLDVLDIVLMVAIVIGNEIPTDYHLMVGDLTGDSLINILDIVALVALIIN